MATNPEEFELFDGKSLSSLFKDIFDNSVKTKEELKTLIQAISNMIDDQASASALVPIIKEYLDINVKNDEHLIKLAMIVQRLISAETKGASESDFGLSESEKKALLENAEEALAATREEALKVKTLKTDPQLKGNTLKQDTQNGLETN